MSETITIPVPFAPVKLTRRECEVMTLIVEGRSSKEAADQLFVSKRTIDFHLANVYHKLNVSNRVQAYRELQRRGINLSKPKAQQPLTVANRVPQTGDVISQKAQYTPKFTVGNVWAPKDTIWVSLHYKSGREHPESPWPSISLLSWIYTSRADGGPVTVQEDSHA